MTVNLLGNFRDSGGVGRHARNFAAALARHATLIPIHRFPPEDFTSEDAFMPPPARWDDGAPGICLAAMVGLLCPPGTPRIYYTVWETSRIPPALVHHLRQVQEIWVPSRWCRDVLARNGVDPVGVRIVPEGVDGARFRPSRDRPDRARFRFLCAGKWEERKRISDLVRTFARAFAPDDPVQLVLHVHNPYMPRLDVHRALQRSIGDARTVPIRLSEPSSLESLIGLMQTSDASVLPGEAWGLPILEAMACGLPCLVTNYGGHLTFANQTNSYMIEVERMRPVADPYTFPSSIDFGEWPQPDLDPLLT